MRTPRTERGWARDFDRAEAGRYGPEWKRRASELQCEPRTSVMLARWRELRTPADDRESVAFFRGVLVGLVLVGIAVAVGVLVAGWLA